MDEKHPELEVHSVPTAVNAIKAGFLFGNWYQMLKSAKRYGHQRVLLTGCKIRHITL